MPQRRRSRSEGTTTSAASNNLLSRSLAEAVTPAFPRRSMSELFVRTSDGVVFQDEAFQRETQAKAERLVETASSPESSERNALIAKKALRYRQMRAQRPETEANGVEGPTMTLRTKSCPAPGDQWE